MNVPKLRFKEFDGEYQEYSIENLLNEDIKNGTQNNPGINEAKIKFINVVNLYSAVINAVSLPYINKDITKINHLLVEKGDLFYTRSSITYEGIGYCNLYNDEYTPITYDDHIMRVKILKNIAHPKYVQLASIVPSARKYFLAVAKRGTMTTIGQSELKKLMLNIPTIEEQRKVALFFEKIDGKIQLQQQKIDLLQEQKKGYMQKIFNQEIRFKDEKGEYHEWQNKSIDEVAKIIMGQSPDSKAYSEDPANTVLVQGNADLKNGKIVPRIYTSQLTKMCEIGDIILTVRAPVGIVAKCNIPACIGRGVCAIKADDFLFYYLDYYNMTSQWAKLSQGSTFESVNSNDIKNIVVPQPCEEEKMKISKFFKRLIERIQLEEEKLLGLKLQKQGFMQQMFI